MISSFIKIRFIQFWRGLAELGVLRVLFLSGALFLGALFFFALLAATPNVYYVTGAFLAGLVSIQIRRKDSVFLRTHFSRFRLLLFAEYFLVSLPLLIGLIYHQQWQVAAVYAVLLILIPFLDLDTKRSNLNTWLQKRIPSYSFEWKAGVRRMFFPLCITWLVGMAASFFIGSAPIALFIIGIILLGFYDTGEPLQILMAPQQGSRKLIMGKITNHLILFFILSLPLMLVFVLFHYEAWFVILVEFLLLTSLHVYIILAKYTFYLPDTRSSGAQMFAGIGAVCVIIPFLVPVVWVLSAYFYNRSINNLNFYLDDFH